MTFWTQKRPIKDRPSELNISFSTVGLGKRAILGQTTKTLGSKQPSIQPHALHVAGRYSVKRARHFNIVLDDVAPLVLWSGVLKGCGAEAGGAAGGRKCLNNRPMFYFRLLGAKSNVIKRTKIKDLGKKAIVLEIEVFVKKKNGLFFTILISLFCSLLLSLYSKNALWSTVSHT